MDKLYCGDYRVLDARAAIREEAPDVVQKVRILTLSKKSRMTPCPSHLISLKI